MKIKKLYAVILAFILMGALAACGGGGDSGSDSGNDSGTSGGEPKTLADAFAVEVDDQSMVILSDKVVYIYLSEGKLTRVEASINEDIYNEADAIPFDDEDRDQKVRDILGPAEITRIDDMTDTIPSEDEVNALIGKTGQELLDDGFALESCYSEDESCTVNVSKNYAEYMLEFDGAVNDEDDSWKEEITALKVTSASYTGVAYSALEDYK